MFVVTFDQRGATGGTDRVPELLAALSACATRLPPERTSGDEAQVLTDRAEATLDLVRVALELGEWSVGLGIGTVALPLPASVREARGDAFTASRSALGAARPTSAVPLAVRSADPRHAATAADAEAVLRLIGWLIRTRNQGQWRVVRARRAHPEATQEEIATRLGVTQQTVSRALRTSGWREESSAYSLVCRLLAMIDLTTGGAAPVPSRTVS